MYTTSNSDAETQGIRASWDSVADGYDRYVTDLNSALAGEAVKHVGVGPGVRFLDVAAGSGALGIQAAKAGAEVTAIDLSPRMVERLQARASREGLAQVQVQVMDGQALEFADDTFDIAGSQYGVMLFPDLPLGLSEMARVTRPGGRVMVVAFGPPPKIEFITLFLAAIKAAVRGFKGLPTDPPPLPFQLADPQFFHTRLLEAGLSDISIETIVARHEYETGLQMWNSVAPSNPIAASIIAGLSPEQVLAAQQALDEMVRERAGADGTAELTHPVHIGIGTVS